MNNTNFDSSIALMLLDSSDEFPIEFDLAWQWLGYSKKENAKASLLQCDFEIGIDLLINQELGTLAVPRPKEHITLTVDCFKTWAMMAGTEQGRKVRRYFIDCEKIMKCQAAEIRELKASIKALPPRSLLRTTTVTTKSCIFTLYCHKEGYPVCLVHDYITVAITGMTAKQLRDIGWVDGNPTIGLNHIVSVELLLLVSDAKLHFARIKRKKGVTETWQQRADRAIRKAKVIAN
jgi:hypothetical protein